MFSRPTRPAGPCHNLGSAGVQGCLPRGSHLRKHQKRPRGPRRAGVGPPRLNLGLQELAPFSILGCGQERARRPFCPDRRTVNPRCHPNTACPTAGHVQVHGGGGCREENSTLHLRRTTSLRRRVRSRHRPAERPCCHVTVALSVPRSPRRPHSRAQHAPQRDLSHGFLRRVTGKRAETAPRYLLRQPWAVREPGARGGSSFAPTVRANVRTES